MSWEKDLTAQMKVSKSLGWHKNNINDIKLKL